MTAKSTPVLPNLEGVLPTATSRDGSLFLTGGTPMLDTLSYDALVEWEKDLKKVMLMHGVSLDTISVYSVISPEISDIVAAMLLPDTKKISVSLVAAMLYDLVMPKSEFDKMAMLQKLHFSILLSEEMNFTTKFRIFNTNFCRIQIPWEKRHLQTYRGKFVMLCVL